MDLPIDTVITYEVKHGDTLSGIACRYGYITPTQLARINKLNMFGSGLPPIFPGQKLLIPDVSKLSDHLSIANHCRRRTGEGSHSRLGPGTALRVRPMSMQQPMDGYHLGDYYKRISPPPASTAPDNHRIDVDEGERGFVKVPTNRVLSDQRLISGVLVITPKMLLFEAGAALAEAVSSKPSSGSGGLRVKSSSFRGESDQRHNLTRQVSDPGQSFTTKFDDGAASNTDVAAYNFCIPISSITSFSTFAQLRHAMRKRSKQPSHPVTCPVDETVEPDAEQSSPSAKSPPQSSDVTKPPTQSSPTTTSSPINSDSPVVIDDAEDDAVNATDSLSNSSSKVDLPTDIIEESCGGGDTASLSINGADDRHGDVAASPISPPIAVEPLPDATPPTPPSTPNSGDQSPLDYGSAKFLYLRLIIAPSDEYVFKVSTENTTEVYSFLIDTLASEENDESRANATLRDSPVKKQPKEKPDRNSIVEQVLESLAAESPVPVLYEGASDILSTSKLEQLAKKFPSHKVGSNLSLVFNTSIDGFSLNTLYRKSSEVPGCILLVIRDTLGTVFGALLSERIRFTPHYYGTGETSVFVFVNDCLHWYEWTKKNYFFMRGSPESFEIGGQSGRNAIWFDAALKYGRSEATDTFDNPVLSGHLSWTEFSHLFALDVASTGGNSGCHDSSMAKDRSQARHSTTEHSSESVPFVIESLEAWELVD